jgi:hypothetical protein
LEDSEFTATEESTASSEQCQINVNLLFWHWRHRASGICSSIVPAGQTVNGKFYCDVLRRLRENIRCKRPDKWCSNSWVLHDDNAPAHASLVVRQVLASTNTSHPPPTLLTGPRPLWFFPFPKDKNWSSRGDVLTALKRFRPNRRTCEDADTKLLPAVLPMMEIPLESLH